MGDSHEINAGKASTRKLVFVIALTVIVTLFILALFSGLLYILLTHKKPSANPFTNGYVPAESFPLYYTTAPPSGFTADEKSISEPQAGVVVYDLTKGSAKIVISEEARNSKMVSIGAFYQRFTNLKETTVSDGSIATGYYHSLKVASLANNTTWIIATTTDNVSFAQLTTMMKNLRVAI